MCIFHFLQLHGWGKSPAEARSSHCAVLPSVPSAKPFRLLELPHFNSAVRAVFRSVEKRIDRPSTYGATLLREIIMDLSAQLPVVGQDGEMEPLADQGVRPHLDTLAGLVPIESKAEPFVIVAALLGNQPSGLDQLLRGHERHFIHGQIPARNGSVDHHPPSLLWRRRISLFSQNSSLAKELPPFPEKKLQFGA